MAETKQTTEQEQLLPVAEREQPPLTPEELQRLIKEGREEILQFEKDDEGRAGDWEKQQEIAGTDPKIVGAARGEFDELVKEAQGVLSIADQNLAAIGYRRTGEHLVGTDGKPSLAFIEEAPKPENGGVREPKPGEVYVGAVQNPDGTWDMSQALETRDDFVGSAGFKESATRLVTQYRESYSGDESYQARGGYRDKFDVGERQLKALANARTEDAAGKAGNFLTGLEMIFNQARINNNTMIADAELLEKGTISEEDHQRDVAGYKENGKMIDYVGRKLFPDANCKLSAENYSDIVQQISDVGEHDMAVGNVSYYFPEGLESDRVQEILESGNPEETKRLALHLNQMAQDMLINFKPEDELAEAYDDGEKVEKAVQTAELFYRLRSMSLETTQTAYDGEEGRTIYDAQKDLFGAKDQEKGSANDTVESPQTVREEAETSGEREETSVRLDRDLDALKTLSRTGLPTLFDELQRVQIGQISQEDFEFIADSMETPLNLVEDSGEITESMGELLQAIKSIQEICRDQGVAVGEKSNLYVQGIEKLQGILEQKYGVTPQKSEPGSDRDRNSQEVVGIVATDDPLLDNKVAESKWCGFNNPDYTYRTPSGEEENRMQTVRHERVTIYKYDPGLKQEGEIDDGSESESIQKEADMGDNASESPEGTKTVAENAAGDDEKPDKSAEDNPMPVNETPNAMKGSSAERTNTERANPYEQIAVIRDKLIEGAEGTWIEGKDELINNLVEILDEADSPYVLKNGIDVLVANGEYGKAPKYLQKAEDNNIISETNEPDKSALFSCQLAELAIKCEVPDIARMSAIKAEKIVDDYIDGKAPKRLSEIAHVYIVLGDRDEAERVAGRMDDLGQDIAVRTVRAEIGKRFSSGGFWTRVRNRK